LECSAIKHELKACACIPEETDGVLTGRYAPTLLVDRADLVNEVKDSKHLDEMVTLAGIQY
jgi:cob(I)alamin adenosyltransferase